MNHRVPRHDNLATPIVRRRASRPAFPRWSVRNDHRNYRAALRVATCIPTLERAERSSQLSCGAPRRDLHSCAGACGTIIATIVRRSASRPAFLRWSVRSDNRNYRATLRVETCIPTLELAERSSQLSCGAPRRDLHSYAGACGTIIATIVRRSASRPAFPRWSVRNDHRNYRAAHRVATCIPTLERAERSSQLSCGAPRRDLHSYAGA